MVLMLDHTEPRLFDAICRGIGLHGQHGIHFVFVGSLDG